ncbi:MAG: alpha/beta hydrolase family protein [Longimicrobiales bacterium]
MGANMMIRNAFVGLAILVLAAQSSTGSLPPPTGPFKTGRMSFHWRDSARAELETRTPDDRRELMVHLFYPADPSATNARAPYMPDADQMRPPWNDEQVARIKALRAYSRENAPPLGGSRRFPVVLFGAGGGMKVLTYHALIEDLASHGYLVAAIDGPYNPRSVQFPDGRVLGSLAPAARGWPAPRNAEEGVRFYTERVAHMAGDMSFVIDQLVELDRGNGPLAGRVDLARGAGAVGHSRGGQAAGAVRTIDRRVCGGVNLDGTAGPNAVLPIKQDEVGRQPFLWILNPLPVPTAQQLERAGRTMAEYNEEIARTLAVWDTQMKRITGGAIRVTIANAGAEHIDFSDEVYWDRARTPEALANKMKTLGTTRSYLRAFLEGCHKGEWTNLKRLVDDAGKSAPEVTATVSSRPWRE